MDRTQAAHYYSTQYPERQRDPAEFFREQADQNAPQYLARFIRPDMDILDYGCGPGGKLAGLASRGFRISGFDLNPLYLEFAESRGLRRVAQGRQFDLIYLSHTLEHWTDLAEDLQNILQSFVRPGGTVAIEVPLLDRLLLGGRRDGIHGDLYFVHIWYFSVRSLDKLMNSLGCRRVHTDRLTLCVYTFEGIPEGRTVAATPLYDAGLRTLIAVCSNPIAAVGAGLINRVIRYIDLSAAARLNPKP